MGERHVRRHPKFTTELLNNLLAVLMNNGGIIGDACFDLNIARRELYYYLDKHPNFKKQFYEAVDKGIDVIEDEAKRRALDGTKKPIYYEGNLVGFKQEKSDTALTLILKGHRARYKERVEMTGADGQPLNPAGGQINIYIPDNNRDKSENKE